MTWWVVASDGRRWELDRPLALGGDGADLDFPEFFDAEICRLSPGADQCELEAHVNPSMFRIDGPSLVSGRVLTVMDQLALRLEQCTRAELAAKPTPADPRHRSLPLVEAMLSSDPTGWDQWHVYADQLEEDGDPRADRVRQGQPRSEAQSKEWSAALGGAGISIDWQHGFAWRAVSRPAQGERGGDALTHLCSWEGARFLRELHLQLHHTNAQTLARDWVPALLDAPLPLTLERISFGGMRPNQLDTSVLPQLSALCTQLTQRCPKLKGLTVHSLFFTEHLSGGLEATNHRETIKISTRGTDFAGVQFTDRGGVISSSSGLELQPFDALWLGDRSYRAVWRSMWP